MINHRKEQPYLVHYTLADNVTYRKVVYAKNLQHALDKALILAPLHQIVGITIWGLDR